MESVKIRKDGHPALQQVGEAVPVHLPEPESRRRELFSEPEKIIEKSKKRD